MNSYRIVRVRLRGPARTYYLADALPLVLIAAAVVAIAILAAVKR